MYRNTNEDQVGCTASALEAPHRLRVTSWYPGGGEHEDCGAWDRNSVSLCLNIYVFKGCTNYSPFYSIWIFDLATQLPTVQLHGVDISDSQYPSKELWSPNVMLGLLDSLVDPPSSLYGQYDVVHLRMWASNLRGDDISLLSRHVKHLLSKTRAIPVQVSMVHSYRGWQMVRTWRLSTMGGGRLGTPAYKGHRGRRVWAEYQWYIQKGQSRL